MIFKTFWRKKEKTEDKSSALINKSDDFKYKAELEMRFADLDAMGHVNNAIYFTYLEIGRTKYWQQVIKWDWCKTAIVVRTASIEYLSPVHLGDKIGVYVRTDRVGKTSFDLTYQIFKVVNQTEITCCKGKTTCVVIDHHTKQPTAIPETERLKMMEFEQLAQT